MIRGQKLLTGAVIGCLSWLALLAPLCQHAAAQRRGAPSAARAVRQTWENYKKAILGKDGAAALALVNQTTVGYYGQMRTLALRATEAEVKALSVTNKIMVLSYRHRLSPEQLEAMNAEELFVHGVSQGWIGEQGVLRTTLGSVRVSGGVASGEAIVGGKATPLTYRFEREGGKWKIDLAALMPVADIAMRAVIKELKVEEDQFILDILESLSGVKPSADIWKPPARQQQH